jgi:hypothetical protein
VRDSGLRRPLAALAVVILVLLAVGVAVARTGHHAHVDAVPAGESEGTPAIARHLATRVAPSAVLAPPGSSNAIEGDRTSADDEFLKRAIPGDDIPAPVLQNSKRDWEKARGRGDEGSGRWSPLGPTWAKSLPNPYRDRSVYTAGNTDFSGRIAHVAIDPSCGSRGGDNREGGSRKNDGDDDNGGCRLWIANANGGVWRTNNALAQQPKWKYLSMEFEHNNVASLQLDPNDKNASTIWAGTGEPNACGSGCEAGVGLYKSTNRGESWSGPYGKDQFYDRAVGSIAIKPGNSNVMFAASGRAVRGVSNVCCGGADAIIPGAPHFGLWRSLDGGRNWELVNQGAAVLCTASSPDDVSLNLTPCSARGARRVMIDPVDPNTVYASFFARGIWRSRSNGDPGTWEQIMARVGGPGITTERAEFDVVKLPNGETRMYVGVGGGGVCGAAAGLPSDECTVPARFRKNDNVRSAPAAVVAATWQDMTSMVEDTPGFSSWGFCDPQCSYDSYVFVPAAHFPNSGADANTVYLSGANRYRENNWGAASPFCCPDNPATGRSNGRAVLVSTDAGATFTDMTDDTSDNVYPVELHPDHHALTVNPTNWKQFFDVGDGGIVRSNGRFADDSGDCVQPKGYTGTRLAFCQVVLKRVPERLTPINKGLRTLHFYEIQSSPFNPSLIVGGTQDNGSWERGDTAGSGTNSATPPPDSIGAVPTRCQNDAGNGRSDDDDNSSNQVWVQINLADGGHNNFDIGDPCFRQSAWQGGQLMVSYVPKNQLDMNWIADTLFQVYGSEATQFIGLATFDRVHPHWLWTSREHVFRSINQGRNDAMSKEQHRQFCNVWYGTFSDFNNDGRYDSADFCDDWKPLGDPGPNGRLTSATYGATKPGGSVAAVERATGDGRTLWAATSTGRVFVSKNADNPVPSAVTFDRIDDDPTAANTPPRYPTAIYIDPKDGNHAWITYSGFNAKTPGTPGHIFEVRYVPGASTFKLLDGNQPRDALGDIPATSVAVSPKETIYVGTDYGCIASKGNGVWRECGDGLPNLVVADLLYVPEKKQLYAATHGQGVWSLDVKGIEDDDRGRGNDKGDGKRRDR